MKRRRLTAMDKVLNLLKQSNRPLRVAEISNMTGVKYNTVRGVLYRLRKEGFVTMYLGGYILKEKKKE